MEQEITWEEFEEYGPKFAPDDYYLFDPLAPEVKVADLDTIWTLTEEDGVQIISAGYRTVNRLAHLITREKWEHDGLFLYYE